MKTNALLLLVVFSFTVTGLSGQTLEVAGTFSTSDAVFYKNTPGISLAYSHHFKKQFIFAEFVYAYKEKNNYTNVYHSFVTNPGYYVDVMSGNFAMQSYNLGAAQNLISNEAVVLSIGVKAGLNDYKLNNEIDKIYYDPEATTITFDKQNIQNRNKFGMGMFIDMEIQNVWIDNLSVFTRLEVYHSDYANKPVVRGINDVTSDINCFMSRFGLKYDISKN